MTLWAMVRSPLMFGGDVRKLDETTYSLITNPFVLEINSFSMNNMEACETMFFLEAFGILTDFFPDISSHCTCSFLMLLVRRVLYIRPWLSANYQENV
jgi:hypothetical protein